MPLHSLGANARGGAQYTAIETTGHSRLRDRGLCNPHVNLFTLPTYPPLARGFISTRESTLPHTHALFVATPGIIIDPVMNLESDGVPDPPSMCLYICN